jgi:proline iminopeptidase
MVLLGHSWGGFLALQYTLLYPDRVRGLILVGAPGPVSDYEQTFEQNILRNLTQDDKQALSRLNSITTHEILPEHQKEYIRILFRAYLADRTLSERLDFRFSRSTLENLQPVGSYLRRSRHNYDLRDRLGELNIPTLIIHGDSDPLPMDCAEANRRAIPGSLLIPVENCGHFPFFETPETFFSSVRTFLKEL